jgi:hypothetical protein
MTASCEKVPFGHRSSLIWFPLLAVVAFFFEKKARERALRCRRFGGVFTCSSVNKQVAKVQIKETLNTKCVFSRWVCRWALYTCNSAKSKSVYVPWCFCCRLLSYILHYFDGIHRSCSSVIQSNQSVYSDWPTGRSQWHRAYLRKMYLKLRLH